MALDDWRAVLRQAENLDREGAQVAIDVLNELRRLADKIERAVLEGESEDTIAGLLSDVMKYTGTQVEERYDAVRSGGWRFALTYGFVEAIDGARE